MPRPQSAPATLRPDLASMMEFDLEADRSGFIGLRVLPVINVGMQAGVFGKIPLEQLLQSPETKRAARGHYPRGEWEFTTDSYATKENGWEEVVDQREAAIYADYFNAEVVSAMRARDIVLRNQEIRVANLVFNSTTFTGETKTTAVTTEWSNGDSAVPIDDIHAAKFKIWDVTGLWPNALIINYEVFMNLRKCAQIVDRIQSMGAGSATKAKDITAAMLASVFDLEEIIVAGAAKNAAKKGQSASIEQIWSSEYASLARIPSGPDIRQPGLGRTFHWSADGSEIGGTIESYGETASRGDVIRVRHDTDEKLLYTECAHLLSNITA